MALGLLGRGAGSKAQPNVGLAAPQHRANGAPVEAILQACKREPVCIRKHIGVGKLMRKMWEGIIGPGL